MSEWSDVSARTRVSAVFVDSFVFPDLYFLCMLYVAPLHQSSERAREKRERKIDRIVSMKLECEKTMTLVTSISGCKTAWGDLSSWGRHHNSLFIITDKVRTRGKDVQRCRCGERQRSKALSWSRMENPILYREEQS